ncbi:MAG: hypothetical protein LBC35_07740 [Coriobacteriales bacterium]|jgi:uncharacterized surface anchored protein|nr:hypothetical protein [Coriobacteriales bacterium]
MDKTVSGLPAPPDEQKPRDKKKGIRVAVCAVLAMLLALGALIPLFGQSTRAYAGTTGSDTSYYRLYDSESLHSNISHLRVDGNSAFCVEINSEFSSGVYVSKHDAADIYGQALVTRFALYKDYIYSVSWLNDDQRYFITQELVWETLNPGVYPGGLRVEIGVSDQNQTNIKAEAVAYYNRYKNSYVGRGTYWDAGNAQDLAEFWVERHTLGSIELKKASANPSVTDGNNRYSLAGAIYTIYNSDNQAVGTLAIDANGDSNTVSNLWAGEFGTYYVKETKAPTGYEKNTATYTVNLTTDGQVITVNAKDEPVTGGIELQKSSSDTTVTGGNSRYSLVGAEFGVYRNEADAISQQNRFKTITTNAQGYGSVSELPLGTYWVRETKAPQGYALDATMHKAEVTDKKPLVSIDATDAPVLGKLEIEKSSASPALTDGNARYRLSGAEFGIYRSEAAALSQTSRYKTITTNAAGYGAVEGLPFGEYWVREAKAPQGYELSATVHHVDIAGAKTTVKVAANDMPVLGRINLQKSSANPAITEGNACYSLAGAEYGIYRTEAAAKAQTGSYATISTNATGAGSVGGLPLGEYWVREVKEPQGYAVDTTIHHVDIASGKITVQVSATDTPKNDPIGTLLSKADADTALPYAGSDAASLAGAQFTVRYYDAQHATVTDAQADTPTRTWIIKTDDEGFALFDDDYLVGGDALYKNSAGDATIPIGTFTVQETKAPQGYLLTTPALPNSVRLFHITDDGTDGEFLYVYNAPVVREQVMRGDLQIVKYREDEVATPDMPSELKTPEAGVIFDLYASRDFTGVTPSGEAVPALSITTDKDGVASTSATDQVLLQWPDGSYSTRPRTPNDSGCLPYDTYLVVQRDAPQGYSPANRFTVTVNADKSSRTYIVGNVLIASALRVEKRDSETGVVVAWPARWQVLDADTGKPVSMTVHYPATQVLDTFESDAQGWLMLPEMLPVGSYLLHEVEAPNDGRIGYLVNTQNVPFEVTGYNSWDDPLVVAGTDAPAKGRIALAKHDSLGGGAVPGATYVVIAAEDVYTLDGTLRYAAGEQVDELVTDKEGMALFKELYLGSYTVIEKTTPNGFALNTTAYSVELSWQGQTAYAYTEDVEATDTPTTLRILKADATTATPLAGVAFVVEDVDGNVIELTTGEDGYCVYPYLPQGSYKVYETATLPGYLLSDKVWEFTVDANGRIDGQDTFELLFTNDFTKVEVTKTDIATGEPVIGATLQVFPVDADGNITGEPLYEWVTANEPYLIERLPQGDYVLREVLAPAGYLVVQDIAFTVADTGEAQRMEMVDDFTKVEITKTDIATGEPMIGATLQVFPVNAKGTVDEEPLYEWVTTDSPNYVERVPQGSYILREISVPAGHLIAQDVTFTVTDTGDIQRVEMKDDFTKVEVTKTDIATGEPVIGATLQVFPVDADGNVSNELLYEWVTTEEPYLIERLPQGDYVLREQTAPAGYVVAQDVAFTVTDTGDIQQVEMKDDFTKVEITKSDIATGKPIIGATIQVFPVDGDGNIGEKSLYEWVSTEVPYLIERLPQGDCVLREIAAPLGHLIAQDVFFTVADTGDVQKVDMKDDFTKLEITKLDAATEKSLARARLQLIDEDGYVVAEWTSTDKPHLIERLAPGKYTLHEAAAPEGYKLAKDVAVTVAATAEVQKTSISNEPIPEKLDQTGRDGSLPFAAVGILVFMALGGILVAVRQLRKKKDAPDDGGEE